MKPGTILQAAWLILFVAVALPTWAVDPSKPASPTPSRAAPPGAQPLKTPLKLDQASLRTKKLPKLERRDELDRAYDDFRRKYDATVAALSREDQIIAQCRSRTYTIEDQRNAGCRETDTVKRCSDMLFGQCMQAGLYGTWTQMQLSAVVLRDKVLRFSNSPAPR